MAQLLDKLDRGGGGCAVRRGRRLRDINNYGEKKGGAEDAKNAHRWRAVKTDWISSGRDAETDEGVLHRVLHDDLRLLEEAAAERLTELNPKALVQHCSDW